MGRNTHSNYEQSIDSLTKKAIIDQEANAPAAAVPQVSIGKNPTALWGALSPDNIQRLPRLWKAIFAVVQHSKPGLEDAFKDESTKAVKAPEAIVSLMRLDRRLPDKVYSYTLEQANIRPPGDVGYLDYFIRNRDKVREWIPLPETDDQIVAFAEGLNNPLLSALVTFAMRDDDPDATSSTAPAA